MTPADLDKVCAAVSKTVEHEIRTFAILGERAPDLMPPPIDGKAEAEVGSAIVGRNVVATDLPGLHARHFCHPMHRVIYEIAPKVLVDPDGCLNLEIIENELRNRGFQGPLKDWLLIVRDTIPFKGRESCLVAAARVRELWRRRRLIERLGTIGAKLRVDGISADDAISELRTIVSKPLGPVRDKAAA